MLEKISLSDNLDCVARFEKNGHMLRLVSIEVDDEAASLDCFNLVIGESFPDVEAMARSIAGAYRNKDTDPGLLERIRISDAAYKRWDEVCSSANRRLIAVIQASKMSQAEGRKVLNSIEDEKAELLEGARLRISVNLPLNCGTASMVMESNEWDWIEGVGMS